MNKEKIKECKEMNFAGKLSFKELVPMLLASGVERYSVDLANLDCIYYGADEGCRMGFSLEEIMKRENIFSEEVLCEAIKDGIDGKIDYPEFLKRIVEAGVVFYMVFFKGKKVHYYGREGELYVQNFPRVD